MSVSRKLYLITSAILTVLVSVVMLGLWQIRDFAFWTIYGFTVLAIWIVGISAAWRKEENKHFAANLTTLTISIVYFVINIIWSITSAALLVTNGMICLVGHIVLLGLFLVMWILAKMAVQYINGQDK